MAYDDDPSLAGFAKYKMSGNKLKSEREAEATAKAAEAAKPKKKNLIETGVDAINEHKKRLKEVDNLKCGGKVKPKKYARGGGIEVRGKTRGKFV